MNSKKEMIDLKELKESWRKSSTPKREKLKTWRMSLKSKRKNSNKNLKMKETKFPKQNPLLTKTSRNKRKPSFNWQKNWEDQGQNLKQGRLNWNKSLNLWMKRRVSWKIKLRNQGWCTQDKLKIWRCKATLRFKRLKKLDMRRLKQCL